MQCGWGVWGKILAYLYWMIEASVKLMAARRQETQHKHAASRRFRPAWWLGNPHAQTIWAATVRRAPDVELEEEILDTPDGDFVQLHHLASRPGQPRVVFIHGLSGSHRSPYILAMLAQLKVLGWNATVMELRSAGSRLNRLPRLYHGGQSDDLQHVMATLHGRSGGVEPLHVVGFSLGGNLAIKWLGEQGDAALAASVVAVSPPFDLAVSAPTSDAALGGLYKRNFLRLLLPRVWQKIQQHPGCLDPAAVRRVRSIVEFDDAVTAPLHGFSSGQHYYETASCTHYIEQVRRPLLVMLGGDDPMIPATSVPRAVLETHPMITAVLPPHGGHLGFLEGRLPWRPGFWAEDRAVEWLQAREGATIELGGEKVGAGQKGAEAETIM